MSDGGTCLPMVGGFFKIILGAFQSEQREIIQKEIVFFECINNNVYQSYRSFLWHRLEVLQDF